MIISEYPEKIVQVVSFDEEKGLRFVGEDVEGERMEIVELDDHPFFVGLQFWVKI